MLVVKGLDHNFLPSTILTLSYPFATFEATFSTDPQAHDPIPLRIDLALSYRLLQDPLSYNDGNVKEIAEQTLQEAFQRFKETFAANGLDLQLLVIQP